MSGTALGDPIEVGAQEKIYGKDRSHVTRIARVEATFLVIRVSVILEVLSLTFTYVYMFYKYVYHIYHIYIYISYIYNYIYIIIYIYIYIISYT